MPCRVIASNKSKAYSGCMPILQAMTHVQWR